MTYDDRLDVIHANQAMDEKLIWNPMVRGFVDKARYLKALETQDPTQKDYKGTLPNFGGGKVPEWETIGSTP